MSNQLTSAQLNTSNDTNILAIDGEQVTMSSNFEGFAVMVEMGFDAEYHNGIDVVAKCINGVMYVNYAANGDVYRTITGPVGFKPNYQAAPEPMTEMDIVPF